jgi:hypothetical protein
MNITKRSALSTANNTLPYFQVIGLDESGSSEEPCKNGSFWCKRRFLNEEGRHARTGQIYNACKSKRGIYCRSNITTDVAASYVP